jgi:hypothetical protein
MEYKMNKVLLVACLLLTPVPAFSQSASDSDGDIKRDRLEQLFRELDREDTSTGSHTVLASSFATGALPLLSNAI